jgi:hypothetical protein
MLPIGFIAVAVAIRLIGGFSYLRAVVSGRARPYPLSWLLWAITPMITFAAEVSSDVGWRSVVTFALGFTPLMVFIVSMIKNPKSLKLDALNVACILLSLGGIGLWLLTDNPIVAIVVAIIADIFSAVPTIRKTVADPKSEYAPTYALSVLSMAITLMTITDWTFAAYAFPAYVLLINTFMVCLIKRKPKKKRKKIFAKRKKR